MTDRRAALEKAAMLVLMNGSGRITQELWADILKIIDLIRDEVLEEAAQELDRWGDIYGDNAARTIRALKEAPCSSS
jgi:hypothetical protein